MVLIQTQQELVALDLGMQIITRHQLSVALRAAEGTIIDLQARIAELEAKSAPTSSQKVATSST